MTDGSVKTQQVSGSDTVKDLMMRVGLNDGQYLTVHDTIALLEPSRVVQEYPTLVDGVELDVLELNKKTA